MTFAKSRQQPRRRSAILSLAMVGLAITWTSPSYGFDIWNWGKSRKCPSGTAWSIYPGGGKALGTRPQHRSRRQGRCDIYQLVWSVELHGGRASFITGRIPIRSALSVVVAPGDENGLKRKRRPSPSSSRRMVTRPTSRASGIWATSPSSTRSSTASTR